MINDGSRRGSVTIVTNVKDCLRKLSAEDFDEVWLDHDLGGVDFVDPDSRECGMEVIRYIKKTGWPDKKKRPIFNIHSSNTFAANLMRESLLQLGFTVSCSRFGYVT